MWKTSKKVLGADGMIRKWNGMLPFILTAALLALAQPVQASILKLGGPPLPEHGWTPTPWGDPPNDSHNHNHNENVNLENVLDPSNLMYDGYGSWFDDGSGMQFHWTNNPAGRNDPDYFGHGYIPPDQPVLYQYGGTFLDYSPVGAIVTINSTFDLWEAEINGTQGYRNPATHIGFAWDWASAGQTPHITIDWKPQSPGEPFVDTNLNGRWDPGEVFTDQDGDGKFDSSTEAPAWVSPAAFPTLTFVDGWYTDGVWHPTNFYIGPDTPDGVEFDLLSISIHELGHLLGLDDLYNLYSGTADPYDAFPGSVMGTNWTLGKNSAGVGMGDWNPYKRTLDIGSIQGGIDLYSIAEPGAFEMLALGLAALVAARRCRKRFPGR